MKPLAELASAEVKALSGVAFDLDDTLLDHGALTEAAYRSLFRLREAGLRLVVCTGRPAGWAELLVRQWPIDAAVAENGAVAFVPGVACDRASLAVRRPELLELAASLLALAPEARLADDNSMRITDVTIDIGEHRRVSREAIGAMRERARAAGALTHLSSVHLHLTFEPDDKASGLLRLFANRFGEDPTRARERYAYVGDSGNDAAPFAAFATTFGVANVRAHLAAITVLPKYVARLEMGQGFAEIAARIVELR